MATRTALLFAYSGSAFDGYARQPDQSLRTVEGALLAGLKRRGIVASAEAAALRSGSRTDRGVGAVANVVCLDAVIPPERVAPALAASVKGLFPLASVAAPEGFDPRKALRRTYRYHLPVAWVPDGLGVSDLEGVLSAFVGTFDFSAFARLEAGRTPERTVESISVDAAPGLFLVDIVGRSFLWRQVRRMMGATLKVCRGEASRDDIVAALQDPSGAPDLGQAPAEPLVLWDVVYKEQLFQEVRPTEGVVGAVSASWGGAAAEAGLYRELLRRAGGA